MKRPADFELESWIVKVGAAVSEKQSLLGREALTSLDKLIDCVWVADYGMRNAGDLDTASNVYPGFQEEAASLALELAMPCTYAAFTLPPSELERRYFDLFGDIVIELDAKRGEGPDALDRGSGHMK